MEDYTVDWTIDKGPNSRSMQLAVNPFTLIGATTRLGNLSSPLRDRFGVVLRFDFYNNNGWINYGQIPYRFQPPEGYGPISVSRSLKPEIGTPQKYFAIRK